MIAQTEILLAHSEGKQEITAISAPVVEPFEILARLAEEFKLHLLKLSCTKNEVTRSYLISERFTNLSDTERYFFAARSLHALEVYEYTLRRFGTEVNNRRRILGYALERLEHQVKFAYVGKIMLAALRADDVVRVDVLNHLFLAPAVNGDVLALLVREILNKLVRSVTRLTFLTVHKRVGKAAYVTGSYPCFGIHQYRAVYADIVRRFLNKLLPPSLFNIIFKLHAERTVIP